MMQCYCAAARKVARRLTRMYETEMLASGLNPAQFELMNYLRSRPGISQTELADAVDLDQTTLSRNIGLLVKQGWVDSLVGVKDRRTATYKLTRPGLGALKRAMPLWQQARAKVQRAVSDEERVWSVLYELGEAVQP